MTKNALIITPFIWEGGPWRGKRTVYAFLEGLQRAGYEVHVVTATNQRQISDTTWKGLHLHYFHPLLAPGAGDYDAFHSFLTQISQDQNPIRRHLSYRAFWFSFVWGAARRAKEVAREHPPRFLYGINNLGIPPVWWVARTYHLPFFARIMGSPITQWTASPLKLYLARFDELLAFKLPAEAIIVTDDGTIAAEEIHQQLGAPKERIWLFRNGIDKALFQTARDRKTLRQRLNLPQDAKVVLWVSQLVNWKHPERLLNILPQVLAQVPETRVVILGDGPTRGELEALCQRLGVQHAVRFEGFVPRSQLPAYFHAADLFTAFYDYGNISNSLLEAMLSGLPVLALDNGHTSQVVRHMENGLLIPPQHPEQIAEALLTLLQNDQLREALGRQAALHADRLLQTWEERIDREIARIESLLASTAHNNAAAGSSTRRA